MSYVLATPEMVAAAANNLAQIGSTLSAANAAALAPTTGVLAAAPTRCRQRWRRCFPGTPRPIRHSARSGRVS